MRKIDEILKLPIDKKLKLVKADKVAKFYGIHRNTFYDWRHTRPNVFRALLDWYLVFNEDEIFNDEN